MTSAGKPMHGCVAEVLKVLQGLTSAAEWGVAYGPIYAANGPGELDQVLT